MYNLFLNLISGTPGFSETGELCAMKEVSFIADDAKSTETFKEVVQVS